MQLKRIINQKGDKMNYQDDKHGITRRDLLKSGAGMAALAMTPSLPEIKGAKRYVVNNAHPSASDANPGTEAAPFKTIGKAEQIAKPGDTVIVKAGIYREFVNLTHSGAPGAPISFVADPPGSVHLLGTDILTGWTKTTGEAPIYQVPWTSIFIIDWNNGKPIQHYPSDAPLWGRAEQVFVNDAPLHPALTLQDLQSAWGRHAAALAKGEKSPVLTPPVPNLGPQFAGMFAADTVNKILYVWLADGSDPNQSKMEASTRAQTFGTNPWANPKGVEYVHVSGFHFQYGASFCQRGVVWLYGRNNLIEDCLIEDMAGSGVNVNGTMRRCVIRRCGQTGGGATGDGCLNEDSFWEGNCWKPIDRGWDAGGFKTAFFQGGTFRNLYFKRNGGPGLWFDVNVENVLIEDCVFQENEGSGLFIEISKGFTVRNCLSFGNCTGVVGNDQGWSSGGIQLGESEDCTLIHNTCVGNRDGITFREQGPRGAPSHSGRNLQYHNIGHIVKHNVCAFNLGYQLGLWYDNDFFGWHPAQQKEFHNDLQAYQAYLKTIPDKIYNPAKQNIVIDNNIYYSSTEKPLFLYGVPWRPLHKEFDTLKAFSECTGFDKDSIVANPRIVDRSKDDFRFQQGSVAYRRRAGWLQAPKEIVVWMRAKLPKWLIAYLK
jgi:hypothetical protein